MWSTLTLLALVAPSQAATLQVGVGKPYARIGQAVAAAANGDTIEVDAGAYNEFFDVSVDVTIIGLGGSAGNTWTAAPGEDVIEVFGGDLTVIGFTFEPQGGRAVDLDGGSITIEDVIVHDNVDSDRDGAGLRVQNGVGTLSACTFENNVSPENGGHVAVYNGELTITDCTLAGGEAVSGGALYAEDAVVTITTSTLSSNDATGYVGWNGDGNDGGAIHALASQINLVDTTLADNLAGNIGGAVNLTDGASALFDGATFDGNVADFGGAVYLGSDGSIEILDSAFVGNLAQDGSGGAIRWRSDGGDPAIDITDSTFEANEATEYGGALGYASNYGDRGAATFIDVVFEANSATWGGAMSVTDIVDVTGIRGLYCANQAAYEGGAVRLRSSGSGTNLWTNNVFDANSTDGPGGGMYLLEGSNAIVRNNTFVGNSAADGGAARAQTNDWNFQNNLVAWTIAGNGLSGTAAAGTVNYDSFWENDPGNLGGGLPSIGANSLTSDPGIGGFVQDLDCGNDDLYPLAGSPLIDAGNPALPLDADGSVADIGAYGGPEADLDVFVDDDLDGFNAAEDCDDANGAVNPGAVEICNGVDDNCDEAIDEGVVDGAETFYEDADGDGVGSKTSIEACGTPDGYVTETGDCDDGNAAISPLATEICNEVDDDCDAEIDEGVAVTWYTDADLDGYGVDTATQVSCQPVPGSVDVGGDCDDADAAINPAAEDEEGDGLDTNCDGADGIAVPPDPFAGESLVAGCACANGSSGPGAGWWLGAAMVALGTLRRRR